MNALINFFIDRYKATLTFLALILVWGASSIGQIPASAYSDINIPYVFVSTFYDGASPEDVERLITRPIEDRLKSIDDLKAMQSYSRNSMSYVILEFPDSVPKPVALVISFPSNPTAQLCDLEFYKDVVAFAKKNELWILSDLAYAEIYYNNSPPPSILQIKNAKDVAVEFTSLSKTFSFLKLLTIFGSLSERA